MGSHPQDCEEVGGCIGGALGVHPWHTQKSELLQGMGQFLNAMFRSVFSMSRAWEGSQTTKRGIRVQVC